MKGRIDAVLTTEYDSFMLVFKSSGILDHIVQDSRKYKKFRNANGTSKDSKNSSTNIQYNQDDLEESFFDDELENEWNIENQFREFIEPQRKRKKGKIIHEKDILKYITTILTISIKVLPDYTMHWSKEWYSSDIVK